MTSPVRAITPLVCALALPLAVLAGAGTAAASPPESKITSPAGTIYPLQDRNSPGPEITVAGRANFGEAAIRCYYGTAASSYVTLAGEVTVSGGAFTAAIPRSGFLNASLCRMRAVPLNETKADPPSTEGAFNGPLVAQTVFESEPRRYSVAAGSLGGMFSFEAADTCGEPSWLYRASTDERSEELFFCTSEIRRGLKVDGDYGYMPGQAETVDVALKGNVKNVPELSVSRSFDESSGQITITEEDPIVQCSPQPAAAPTELGCTEFVSTGVTLRRTWHTADAGRLATLRDAWTSVDGRAHTLEYRSYTELAGAGEGKEGLYEFPGESGFSATETNVPIAVPSGPGTILYKRDADTPEGGDELQPQGAVVYDRAPSAPIAVPEGSSEEPGESAFELPYSLNVPSGGQATVRMAFIQAFALPEVRALAAEAVAGFAPTIAIGSPADGSTTTAASATVTGTVADSYPVTSVTVNGQAASMSGKPGPRRCRCPRA